MELNKNIIENLLQKNNRTIKVLGTIAIVIGSVVSIAGGYTWYRSNLWKPDVKIISVDFNNAVAWLNVNGKQRVLYGGSTLAAGGEWGVRFGTNGNDELRYNIIEVVKNDMVYKTYST